jgi:citrate synthase
MLTQIKKKENIATFLDLVKERKTVKVGPNGDLVAYELDENTSTKLKPSRLQGFGHRIYKTHDPRVKICKSLALEVRFFGFFFKISLTHVFYSKLFDLMGKGSLGDLALDLEEAALSDSYFSSRGLYPNIDYWCAIVFHTMGFSPGLC